MPLLLVPVLAVTLVMATPGKLVIEYPEDGSIFPPEFAPPTVLWRDSSPATLWRIEVPGSRVVTRGPRPTLAPIDPDCVAPTNELPQPPAQHSWRPGAVLWRQIQRRRSAAVTIVGYRGGQEVSRARVNLSTSRDPVGAPIFYRDVPLMPTEVEKGVIKPLAARAIPLVAWRIRDVRQAASRVVMSNLPVCANCHSFSADGSTLGMDLDGLEGNRGLYIFKRLAAAGTNPVGRDDVLQWSSQGGKLGGKVRVGFMSQVSPDGERVLTTIDPRSLTPAGRVLPESNYYVANFRDYRFLQVFFPTRGVLCWFSRASGHLEPLPGADDPQFVQMGGVWSPDGKSIVFARAAARDPDPAGGKLAAYANDPDELQIRYDLYRIPFQGGRGGVAQPVAGASNNGRSNTFPKISPDGRWIVYVQSRNGQLMRPDSELYIVPATGGSARRMRANTRLMNSWHSFSPNGRWLVFSSKARSPYTQMYLTHIDAEGQDSPAILIENSTASNRAVNLPEFVNLGSGRDLREIGGPALDAYRSVNRAMYLQKQRRFAESVVEWNRVLELLPDEESAHRNLGTALMMLGRRAEAGAHLGRATELRERKQREWVAELEQARDAEPEPAAVHAALAEALVRERRWEAAERESREAAESMARRGDAEGAKKQWQRTEQIRRLAEQAATR